MKFQNIDHNAGTLICDSHQCPATSTKCSVWRKNSVNDINTLTTSRKCFDSNGKINYILYFSNKSKINVLLSETITFSDQYDSVNRRIDEIVNSYSEATTSGNILQCSNCVGNSPIEITANQRRNAAEFSKKMNKFETNMNEFGKRMSNMGKNMQLDMERTMREAFGR